MPLPWSGFSAGANDIGLARSLTTCLLLSERNAPLPHGPAHSPHRAEPGGFMGPQRPVRRPLLAPGIGSSLLPDPPRLVSAGEPSGHTPQEYGARSVGERDNPPVARMDAEQIP